MKDVIGIVLGGGRGTRLYPLTLARAKPAVGFAGKYRIIDIPLSNCIHSGIKRVFVLTQFLSASLHRHIKQTYQFDTFTDGFIDILAAEQTPQRSDWFQGTADAVRATLSHITYYQSRQALILSGDHLYRMDYRALLERHRERGAEITLCVHPVSRGEASQMGLLRASPQGLVEEFVEKPTDPAVLERFRVPPWLLESMGLATDAERYLASMGVYVFESRLLFDLLRTTADTDFGKEIIPATVGRRRVLTFPFSGYWRDIGTIASYFDASVELAQRHPPFQLYQPHWPIFTRPRSLPPSRIIESEIEDSLLGEGSEVVGAHISDSVIGLRSVIRDGSELQGVVMEGADYYEGEEVLGVFEPVEQKLPPLGIGRGCRIARAILDKNVRIGDGVVIRARPEVKELRAVTHWIQDGITIIPKGTVIPPGTVL